MAFPIVRRLEPSVRLNWILVGAMAVLLLLVLGRGQRIGDGSQYTIMLLSWAEQLQPYVDATTQPIYERYVATYAPLAHHVPFRDLLWKPELINAAGQADFGHFWFYSLCAAPFYWPLKALGLDPGLSFNLLHVTLIGLAVHLCHRLGNVLLATALLAILTLSPLLWFLDKAHTEIFTVCLVTGALAAHQARHHVGSALLFALAGTQNPPFFVVALLALGWRAADRARPWRKAELLGLVGVGGLGALHTLYYYARLGVLTPQFLDGGAVMDRPLVLVKESLCFLVDPDVGLFANWPAAGLLVIVWLWAWHRRRILLNGSSLAFALLVMAIMAWSHSRSDGFNHGGTISISRYALWYLPFCGWVLAQLLETWPTAARARLGLLVVASVLGVRNGLVYDPRQPEDYFTPTALSGWLYAHWPSLYDPIPEIYVMRQRRADVVRVEWAIGNAACQKILVLRHRLLALRGAPPPPVVNCPLIDPLRLEALARERFLRQVELPFFYLDAPGPELRRPAVAIAGPTVSFGSAEQSARLTGAGWAPPDGDCLWAKAERSRIVFGSLPLRSPPARGLEVRYRLHPPPDGPGLRSRVVLNGVALRTTRVRPGQSAEIELLLPASLLRSENELWFRTTPDTLRGWLGSSDDSAVRGLCLHSFELVAEGQGG